MLHPTDLRSHDPLTAQSGKLQSGGLQSGGLQCLAPPIWDPADQTPARKKQYRGPFDINVIKGKTKNKHDYLFGFFHAFENTCFPEVHVFVFSFVGGGSNGPSAHLTGRTQQSIKLCYELQNKK